MVLELFWRIIDQVVVFFKTFGYSGPLQHIRLNVDEKYPKPCFPKRRKNYKCSCDLVVERWCLWYWDERSCIWMIQCALQVRVSCVCSSGQKEEKLGLHSFAKATAIEEHKWFLLQSFGIDDRYDCNGYEVKEWQGNECAIYNEMHSQLEREGNICISL